jgi:hypothetical protein
MSSQSRATDVLETPLALGGVLIARLSKVELLRALEDLQEETPWPRCLTG